MANQAQNTLTGYELSRAWFDWSFENPELVSPNHVAIFFFAIEHCNRLGWKEKFGFPTQMAKDAVGIKKHQTYIKYFNDLVEWGFFKLIQKSENQYSANIISLQIGMLKKGKALGKAISKHGAKQTGGIYKKRQTTGQTTGQTNSPIDKLLTINQEPYLNIINGNSKKNEILESKIWIQSIAMHKKIPESEVCDLLETFLADLILKEDFAKPIQEIKKHFISWLNIQIKENGKQKGNQNIRQASIAELGRGALDRLEARQYGNNAAGGGFAYPNDRTD